MDSEVTVTLTDEEKTLLQRYSRFYKELNDGIRLPKTADQRRFVEVCYGRAGAESAHEIAWVKYKRIAAQERRDAALRLESQQSRMPEFEEVSHDPAVHG